MNIFKSIFFNKPKAFIQENTSNRNRTALTGLKDLNFPMERIRKALVDLNQINLKEIGEGVVSTPTVYNTLKGARSNGQARTILARTLGLKVEELFPEA